jgi:flagellar motor switch protein FliN
MSAARASIVATALSYETAESLTRQSTGPDPATAGSPTIKLFRSLTTHSPYHGDLLFARRCGKMPNQEAYVPTLDKVAVDITVVLGTTSMPIHQVLRLGRGAIIELDASEEDAVSILANNLPVAKGTVVVNGNRIAVNVAELLPRPPDMR